MKIKYMIAFQVIYLITSTASLLSIPIPIVKLKELVNESNFIVRGVLHSAHEVKKITVNVSGIETSATIYEAEINPIEVLKGEKKYESILIHYVVTDQFVGYRGVDLNSPRILFLKKKDNDSTYVFTNDYFRTAITTDGAIKKGDSSYEFVISEIASAIISNEIGVNQKLLAIFNLEYCDHPFVNSALKHAINDANRDVRLTAVAILLEHNDISVFSIAEQNILDKHYNPQDYLQANLVNAIGSGIKNEEAIPYLARMLRANNNEVRRAALNALDRIATNKTLPPLAYALDDSDTLNRYIAMRAISRITRISDWEPSNDNNDSKYLKLWKQWAKDNIK